MTLKSIFGLFLAAVFVGWMMPSDMLGVAPPAAPTNVESVRAAPAIKLTPQTRAAPIKSVGFGGPAAQQTAGGRTVLKRARDGHFYTVGMAQGRQVNFLIDTGASMVALTGSDALSLGIQWSPDELQMVGRGANGDIQGKPVMLDSLQIGDIRVENIRAVVIPTGLDVSLLGQSFLSKIGNVNINQDQMTFN
jgi:aspartyl protease family protein